MSIEAYFSIRRRRATASSNLPSLKCPFAISASVASEPSILELRRRAKDKLRACGRLVGGYSFPPTDFATRRLFLEAFSNRTPVELVINPDTGVV